MRIHVDLGKVLLLIMFLIFSAMAAMAGTVKGTVVDKQTREPLMGATIQVVGTSQGVITDMDGNFTLEAPNGTYRLEVRYVGYRDVQLNAVKITSAPVVLQIEMESDAQALNEVSIVAKKNLEGERALQV